MSVFKCKMCGGNVEFENGATVGICDSCGTKQTLPRLDDEKRANLYDRANHFRRNNEYDKAMGIYEQILSEDNTDSEAYWSLVLCRYGIEYVEDPLTHKRVPTVNRAQFTSIFADEDYKSALQYADGYQKEIYEQEAKAIDDIQKGILAISQKEEPFDVFICYKETDKDGRRTQDSVLANDLYHQLTQEGFKVFFSRITLEDKLGTAYEPYIFAALNSAKVMVVLGTKPEYFNAVWVKNEWSRYLALIKNGAKKALIPAYKDMDPYDLPEEFSHLQAQDMSKLGFMQDLIRGINKLVQSDPGKQTVKETVIANENVNVNIAPLLERAFMFLEDGEFDSADEYCEKVLDQDPKCARAYLGKLMAELKVRKKEDLTNCEQPFDDSNNYNKALRFADEKLAQGLKNCILHINERNENARLEGIYTTAAAALNNAVAQADYEKAAQIFDTVKSYRDSAELAKKCRENSEICRKDDIYNTAKILMSGADESAFNAAIEKFEEISGWRDSDEQIDVCKRKLEEIKAKNEADRLEAERKAEQKRIAHEKAAKKRKKFFAVTTPIVCVCIAFAVLLTTVIIPTYKYNSGVKLFEAGNYTEALAKFISAGKYKDTLAKSIICINNTANNTVSAGAEHTAGLKSDGTVVVTGNNGSGQCDVSGWNNIVAISAGYYHTAGLKSDGTVMAAGSNGSEQCDVSGWKNIIAISAGGYHTVGLKSDGTVVATGNNAYGQCNISDWNNIVAISTGTYHTVGLKSDGTFVAAGSNSSGQCDVSGWKNIIAISARAYCTVGLKSGGTIVTTVSNDSAQCNVSEWKDIIAISAGNGHMVGLKSDGTVVATGKNNYGQCNVSDWKDIKFSK